MTGKLEEESYLSQRTNEIKASLVLQMPRKLNEHINGEQVKGMNLRLMAPSVFVYILVGTK